MNNLSASEKKLLNNLTQVRKPSVLLGDILQGVIDAVGIVGTPRNATPAYNALAISGVVVDGETVTINNPFAEGVDVYEFVTDDAKTKTSPENIAVDISAFSVKASGTLTMDTQPTSGDTITIGDKTFIFVPVGTANSDGEISIGADLAAAKLNLVAAINGADGVNSAVPGVHAANFIDDLCTITALVGGTIGNTISILS